jgi:hypothetical protein
LTSEARLTEATKRFVMQTDPEILCCPSFGCKFISRDENETCGEHGEKVTTG